MILIYLFFAATATANTTDSDCWSYTMKKNCSSLFLRWHPHRDKNPFSVQNQIIQEHYKRISDQHKNRSFRRLDKKLIGRARLIVERDLETFIIIK